MNNNFCNNECRYITLTIRKIDSVSGAGIPGAVFLLSACNGFTCTGTTDSNGLLTFCVLAGNNYMLKEAGAPAGYVPVNHAYNICVDACGRIFIDGVLTSQLIIRNTPVAFSFTAIKVNIENSMPLAGATYTLYMNSSVIARDVSNAAGQITFTGLSPGTYELVETTPPPGFQANTASLAVVVAVGGSVTVNGQPANGFILNDVPLRELIFQKLNLSSGLPLAGATFTLTQNGNVIGTVVSNASGLVNFGVLAAGTYQLTETIAPPGFHPNSAVYQVVAETDGSITVNGVPLDDFAVENTPIEVSAPPTIDTILEGVDVITGAGVAGATVVVTLPNGSTVSTTVNSGGVWLANVPSGVVLAAGDIVSANQTETGKTVSGDVHSIVIGNTDVEPSIDVFVENLTTGQNYAQAGDTLLYDVIVSNIGTASSVWRSAYAAFHLSSFVALQVNSLRINNRTVTSDQYSYDSIANTLTVYLGDIVGGSGVSISYRVTVDSDISDINEIILEASFGSLV